MSDDPKAKAGAQPGAAAKRLRPTVIEAPVKRARRRTDDRPDGPAATPIVTTPTVIPGAARRRIAVSTADMTRLSPDVAPRIAASAVRLVDAFVVEDARDRHAAQWGKAAQQRYAALVPQAPPPSAFGDFSRAQGHVARIVEILAAIDVETIRDARPSGLFGLLAPASGRIDTPRRFKAARAELVRLAALARDALEPLRALHDALDDHARRVDEAGAQIKAAALAALFLSEHLSTARPDLSRRFLQREMDLTATVVEIRGDQFERDSQLQAPRALIAAIQEVVLNALADWLGDASALVEDRRLSSAEAGEFQLRLRAILRKLEP